MVEPEQTSVARCRQFPSPAHLCCTSQQYRPSSTAPAVPPQQYRPSSSAPAVPPRQQRPGSSAPAAAPRQHRPSHAVAAAIAWPVQARTITNDHGNPTTRPASRRLARVAPSGASVAGRQGHLSHTQGGAKPGSRRPGPQGARWSSSSPLSPQTHSGAVGVFIGYFNL